MRVRVFTDPNLHRAAAGGWNLKALAEGKIGTLVKLLFLAFLGMSFPAHSEKNAARIG